MWYRISENICENTEIAKKSKIIENYLKLIDISPNINKELFKRYYIELGKKIKNEEAREMKNFYELILIKGQERGYWETIEKIKNIVYKNLFEVKEFKNLISYSDMDIISEQKIIVREFCDFIWTKFYTKEDKKKYVERYIAEIYPNKKCMSCGINSLSDGEYNTIRSDIDHWFPKGEYPFVSFYKENLFVICNNCNKKKASKIMKKYIVNPYLEKNFKLKLNSFSVLDSKFDIEIEPNFLDYIEEWNNLFNIKSLLKKEFKEKIEDYELTYRENSLENLKNLVERSRFRKEVTEIAYLDFKIRNFNKIK